MLRRAWLLYAAAACLLESGVIAQPLSVIYACQVGDAAACELELAECVSAPMSLSLPMTACLCYATAALCLADCGQTMRRADAAACHSAACPADACRQLLPGSSR